MLYPSVNKIRKKADSRFSLVILAAKRARDIIDGKPALVEDSVNRPVSIAAHEIADDLITYTRGGSGAVKSEVAEVVETEEPVEAPEAVGTEEPAEAPEVAETEEPMEEPEE